MENNTKKFFRKLRQLRRSRAAVLALCEFIRMLGLAGILLTLYVFLDYFLAFSPFKLKVINTVGAATLLIFFLIRISAVLGISLAEIAKTADRVLPGTRDSILSTLELLNDIKLKSKVSDMGRFLVKKLLADSNEQMDKLSSIDIFPKREVKSRVAIFAIQLFFIALLLGIPHRISGVVISRIFHPSEDIPPYSRFVYQLSPEAPFVIYGGSVELSAEISGAPVKNTVFLRIREGGSINSAACFKDGEKRYVQRIEKLTSPVEFCFSVGRSRSKWHKVELRMVPRISLAQLKVKPPAYTNMPTKNFILGRSSLRVLKGSEVTLKITSNRPLSTGDMVITDINRNHKVVKAEKSGKNSLAFTWKAEGKAEISVKIKDVRGTESEKPLDFKQLLLKDKLPEIEISEPDPFFLATTDAKFTVKGYASDDYGLKRVDFIRNIIGYRDRMKHLGPAIISKNYAFTQEFDLAELGVQPGEVMEIYAEAADFNPSLMGLSASGVIKIQIISKEDYADILRMRIKVQAIFRRYAAMKDAFRELKKRLIDFRKELEKENRSAEMFKKKLGALKETNKKAAKLLAKLAEDFPIYEMEKAQRKVFKELYNQAKNNEDILDSMNSGDSRKSLISKTDAMIAAFNKGEKKVNAMIRQVGELEAIVKLMQTAGRYSAMVKAQEEIVRRLSRFKLGNDSGASAMLSRLGEQEKKMAQQLTKLKKDIRAAAAGLPPKYKRIKEDSLTFLDKLESYRITEKLLKSSENAAEQHGNNAYMYGEKALEMMKRAIDKKTTAGNAFCRMCRGEMFGNGSGGSGGGAGGGSGLGGAMRQTAQQMLRSILNQCNNSGGKGYGSGSGAGRGRGGGGGSSAGGEGDINDGYSMDSSSMLDIPVVGPKRSIGGGGGSGKSGSVGRGKGRGNSSVKIKSDAQEKLSKAGGKETETDSISIDDAPYKYRDAVKKYFSEER